MSIIENASAAYDRWIEHGAVRRGLDVSEPERLWPAFWQGWEDAAKGASDFKRRGMTQDDRAAYLSGRFLSAASRPRRKEVPA